MKSIPTPSIFLNLTLLGLFAITSASTAYAFGKKKSSDSNANTRNSPRPPLGTGGERIVKILTYNIQGFPPPFAEDPLRFYQIGQDLKKRRAAHTAPDIVGIQEAWITPITDEVNRQAGYPSIAHGPVENLKLGKGTGSGLVILSEHPITYYRDDTYSACANVDCLANKGIQYSEIQIPGVPAPLIITNTHQNADYGNQNLGNTVDARIQQQAQAEGFFKKNQLSWAPAVFLGDFNHVQGTRDSLDYITRFSTLGFSDALETCGRNPACVGQAQILDHWTHSLDHHYVRSGAGVKVDVIGARTVYTEPVMGRTLSDHVGVEIDYRISW